MLYANNWVDKKNQLQLKCASFHMWRNKNIQRFPFIDESFLSARKNNTCITMIFVSILSCCHIDVISIWMVNENGMCVCVWAWVCSCNRGKIMKFFNEHTNEKHFVCTIHSHLLSIVIVKQLIWVQMNQISTPHTLFLPFYNRHVFVALTFNTQLTSYDCK